jgi:hypothetical protein
VRGVDLTDLKICEVGRLMQRLRAGGSNGANHMHLPLLVPTVPPLPPLPPLVLQQSNMSTLRQPRKPRKRDIPDSFISQWKSSGPKPLARRPMTACHPCRAAKVRCDGQQQCSRCTSRDTVCTYTSTDVLAQGHPNNASSVTDMALPPDVSEEIFIDTLTTDAMDSFPMNNSMYEASNAMADWTTPEASHQPLDDFTWPAMDANMNVCCLQSS